MTRITAVLIIMCSAPLVCYSETQTDTKADWALVDFEGKHQLTEITIEIRNEPGMNFEDGKVAAHVIVADDKSLRQFENACRTILIHPPRKHETAGGLTPTGRMVCKTSNSTFSIFWNREFVLNEETPSTESLFYSMALAVLIDRHLRDAKKDGLGEQAINNLSGQRLLNEERRYYEKSR